MPALQPTAIQRLTDTLLHHLEGEEIFALLCSNTFATPATPLPRQYELLCAIGSEEALAAEAGTAFGQLKDFHRKNPSWLFGFLGYDLKNELERLHSAHPDYIGLPDLYMFRPRVLVCLEDGELTVEGRDEKECAHWRRILEKDKPLALQDTTSSPVTLESRFSKQDYIETVENLREHIAAGDVYEINFCQEFFAKAQIHPPTLFRRLMRKSPNPFSALLRMGDKWAVCSSMERFLRKAGQTLVSQPIKGTIPRTGNPEQDEALRRQLFEDEKERAENLMIVDLVRNDLSHSCLSGSVRVEELFGIYPFHRVFQMISTVSGMLRPEVHWADAIAHAFPAGSMTGAPKVMVMKLIEQYERSKRGMYSGAIGYITPKGDFDFNVVIRTFLYNALNQYLSLHVGSAITWGSVAEREWEECRWKIASMEEALGGGGISDF